MKITKHYPGFVDRGGEPPETAEVMNWMETIALPWILDWCTVPGWSHWSISRNYAPPEYTKSGQPMHLLMAEFTKPERSWYVTAKMEGDDLEPFRALPEFNSEPEAMVKRPPF